MSNQPLDPDWVKDINDPSPQHVPVPKPLCKEVHFLGHGMAACMKPGPPSRWPANHVWSSDWKDVTCLECLRGKEPIETFTVSPDGKSITCKRCKKTSFNPNDVENHYCGFCRVSHDDLWPPARQWWIDNPAT